jgi:hypothetical protein
VSEETIYEIWMEGFCLNGGRSQASRVGTSKGRTFREAVLAWFEKHPTSTFNQDNLTDWGCGLFQTEAEARSSFG